MLYFPIDVAIELGTLLNFNESVFKIMEPYLLQKHWNYKFCCYLHQHKGNTSGKPFSTIEEIEIEKKQNQFELFRAERKSLK